MRIVLVCRGYPTHRPGGMLFVCADRAEELARLGHEVHVFTTGNGEAYYQPDRLNGVLVHHLNCRPMEYGDAFANECLLGVLSLSPDILHFDSFDRARPWWKGVTGCVKSVTMHGFGLGAFLTNWNLRRVAGGPCVEFDNQSIAAEADALATFDRVFAISLHEQTLLEDCYGLRNVRLLYNPIPRYFFDRPRVDPPENRRFLCAAISGQNTRLFHVALEAAKLAGVELVVANSVSRERMPELYDSCTGVVVPTAYAQGFDLTIAEAFARDRSAIVSATGSYYRESRHAPIWPGAMVPVGDVESLARAMRGPLVRPSELAGDPFGGYGLAGRHHPTWHAKAWLDMLTEGK